VALKAHFDAEDQSTFGLLLQMIGLPRGGAANPA